MDSGIAQSIATALAGRRSQREPATQLLAAWEDLDRNFEGLVSALEETRRQLSRGHQIQGALGITEELDRWRGDEEFVKLRDDIAREQDSVKAILDRAVRETVNVGVVGHTGSGKSTFLQRITNLPEDVIPPANGPKPTTAARSRFLQLWQRLPTGRTSALFSGSRGSSSANLAGTAAMLGVSQPHAAMAAAAFAAVIAAAAKVGEAIGPLVAEWLWSEPVADLSAESFRKGLSQAFDRALELIAEQIRIEASELTEALAAIVDEFFDGFIHIPWIEEEYKQLCHPHANELWPGVFGTGAGELSRRLERLGGAARQTANSARTAVDAAHALGGTT